MDDVGKDAHGAVMWRCRCGCGRETIVRGASLVSGATRSCGCGVQKAAVVFNTTHGKSGTPLYARWRSMLSRCNNKKNSEYHNYGGRGITVCDRWRRFENFDADMGGTFHESLEIERRDTNGNYEPSNCLWVAHAVQQRNKRCNRMLTCRGERRSLVEWSDITGIKANTILTRIRRGWSVCKALEVANAR